MLVLSRKLNQEILIGDNIRITVLKVKGNTVRLGIDAPRDVHVLRGELEGVDAQSDQPSAVEKTTDVDDQAKFTVVFSNSDAESSATVDVIPFSSNDDSIPSNRIERSLEETKVPQHEAISFRGRVPKSLERNRLKEIVENMTGSKETATSETTSSK